MKAFCGGYLLGWAASFLVSLAGEAQLWLVRVALTQSCLGAKKDKGAREPRAVAKEWVVPVHRDVKRGGLMGRIQQPWSRCVLLQLPERNWRKGEKGRRGKCDQGWEELCRDGQFLALLWEVLFGWRATVFKSSIIYQLIQSTRHCSRCLKFFQIFHAHWQPVIVPALQMNGLSDSGI